MEPLPKDRIDQVPVKLKPEHLISEMMKKPPVINPAPDDEDYIELIRYTLLNTPRSVSEDTRAEMMWQVWIKPFLARKPYMPPVKDNG